MNNKDKLKVIKHSLEETYKDSREYMDDFYDDCQNGEVEELGWLKGDKEMADILISHRTPPVSRPSAQFKINGWVA